MGLWHNDKLTFPTGSNSPEEGNGNGFPYFGTQAETIASYILEKFEVYLFLTFFFLSLFVLNFKWILQRQKLPTQSKQIIKVN